MLGFRSSEVVNPNLIGKSIRNHPRHVDVDCSVIINDIIIVVQLLTHMKMLQYSHHCVNVFIRIVPSAEILDKPSISHMWVWVLMFRNLLSLSWSMRASGNSSCACICHTIFTACMFTDMFFVGMEVSYNIK